MSCYDPNTTDANFTDLMVDQESLLILCDHTSEENP